MKTKWTTGLTAFLILLFYSGYSLPKSPEISGVIRNSENIPVGDAEIGIFDGFTVRSMTSDKNGAFSVLTLPVSFDLYAVLFFTKDGYIPSIRSVRRSKSDTADYSVVMNRMNSMEHGYLAGVVYQPVKGGKVRYQSGINRLGSGRKVWLEKDGSIAETKTSPQGHYILEVPPGQYVLRSEGSREKPVVEISGGKTVIRNMRSGIILVD